MALDWFYKTVANPIHLSFGVNRFGKTIKVTDEGVIQINKWLKNKLFLFSKNAQANETNISTVIEFLAVNSYRVFSRQKRCQTLRTRQLDDD